MYSPENVQCTVRRMYNVQSGETALYSPYNELKITREDYKRRLQYRREILLKATVIDDPWGMLKQGSKVNKYRFNQ